MSTPSAPDWYPNTVDAHIDLMQTLMAAEGITEDQQRNLGIMVQGYRDMLRDEATLVQMNEALAQQKLAAAEVQHDSESSTVGWGPEKGKAGYRYDFFPNPDGTTLSRVSVNAATGEFQYANYLRGESGWTYNEVERKPANSAELQHLEVEWDDTNMMGPPF